MRLHVAGIIILHRQEGTRNLLGQPSRDRIVGLWRLGWNRRGCHNHFRTERAQPANFFDAHLVGDGKYALVAFDRGHDGERHSHVTGSGLDKGAPGLEQSSALRIFDDRKRNPILNAPPRVARFHFRADGRRQS